MITTKMTKIYVNGFKIDTITTPKVDYDLNNVTLTLKVKAALEDKEPTTITPVPKNNPNFILIYTEL